MTKFSCSNMLQLATYPWLCQMHYMIDFMKNMGTNVFDRNLWLIWLFWLQYHSGQPYLHFSGGIHDRLLEMNICWYTFSVYFPNKVPAKQQVSRLSAATFVVLKCTCVKLTRHFVGKIHWKMCINKYSAQVTYQSAC